MKNHVPAAIALLCILLCNGCIPNQISKIILVENFQQTFNFDELDPSKDAITKNKFIGQILQIDNVDSFKFSRFIGSSKGTKIEKSLYDGNAKTYGNVVLTISIDPYDKNKFIVEGGGNYELFDDDTKQVYFSVTFHITGCDNCNDIKKMYKKKGEGAIEFLELRFTQVAINQFNYPGDLLKYKHSPAEPFKVKVKIKKYGKKIIAVDYGTPTEPTEHEVLFKNQPIGKLVITPPEHLDSKIIDLRGMPFIRKYKKP